MQDDSEKELLSTTSHNGDIEYVNEDWEEFYKFDKNEATGKTHRVIKSGSHPEMFYKN